MAENWRLEWHPHGGYMVRGYADLDKLEELVREKGIKLVFGYYADAELYYNKEEQKYIVMNNVTGAIKYEGRDFKKAFFTAKGVGQRYNSLNDKFFHTETEREFFRNL